MAKLHFITYAEGQCFKTGYPYQKTQELLHTSIESHTSYEVIHHRYNFEKIKKKEWFKEIEHFPNIPLLEGQEDWYTRGGYWCAWKTYLTAEIYKLLNDGDILFFCDSSRHFREPFTTNLDNVLNSAIKEGSILGGCANNITHNSASTYNNPGPWKIGWPESQKYKHLFNQPHLLVTWYMLRKDKVMDKLLEEWIELFHIEYNGHPIFAYSHVPEQGLWNILANKHNQYVYLNKELTHHQAKRHNEIFEHANRNYEEYFLSLHRFNTLIPFDDINFP